MTRRGFLGAIASTAGALALDPERTLWTPGRKLISVPALSGAVRIIHPDELASYMLAQFKQHLCFAQLAESRAREVAHIGDTLNVRRPFHFIATRGRRR